MSGLRLGSRLPLCGALAVPFAPVSAPSFRIGFPPLAEVLLALFTAHVLAVLFSTSFGLSSAVCILSFAFAAAAATARSNIEIVALQWMPMNAMRSAGIYGGSPTTAQDVDAESDWFHVIGVDACCIPTEMVNRQSGRNGPDEVLIRPTMRRYLAFRVVGSAANTEPSVPASFSSASPYPAAVIGHLIAGCKALIVIHAIPHTYIRKWQRHYSTTGGVV